MKNRFVCMLISVILLCTIMLSFVACNNAPLNLYSFAKKREFSFGGFIEDEIITSIDNSIKDTKISLAPTLISILRSSLVQAHSFAVRKLLL